MKNVCLKEKGVLILGLVFIGIFTACGKGQGTEEGKPQRREERQEADDGTSEIVINISGSGEETATEGLLSDTGSGAGQDAVETADSKPEKESLLNEDGSITHQTFEVELSEYDGKVLFVPYAPSEGQPDFHMEISQNGNVLTTIPGYVPDEAAGEDFVSLDAVSFYDVNYDGFTDLVLIETYGNTSFAAVYYGFDKKAAEDYERCFSLQSRLSEAITREALVLSVPGIRDLLSGGKRNGQFTDYKEAYKAVAALCRLDGGDQITYDLIDFDGDSVPELAADLGGYYVSLYTYENGIVYMLMDKWGYGAMGNAGYEYAPGKNSMRNYNTDYAGAILHITYMEKSDTHTLETAARVDFYNFDDVNQNGIPDEEEMGSMGLYGKSYLNGVEATDEECDAYDMGEYEFINGSLSFEELTAKLQGM